MNDVQKAIKRNSDIILIALVVSIDITISEHIVQFAIEQRETGMIVRETRMFGKIYQPPYHRRYLNGLMLIKSLCLYCIFAIGLSRIE